MKKGVALITYIHEASVKSWHQFLNLCDVDVAHREGSLTRFVLVFHQLLVLHESDGNVLLLDINYNFACHSFFNNLIKNVNTKKKGHATPYLN